MIPSIRKSQLLNLSFPYDWSSTSIRDEALILNVLERGIYEDICCICAHYGPDTVENARADIPDDIVLRKSLDRMMCNIRKGFARAQAR